MKMDKAHTMAAGLPFGRAMEMVKAGFVAQRDGWMEPGPRVWWGGEGPIAITRSFLTGAPDKTEAYEPTEADRAAQDWRVFE